ncbi:MAG: CBS domain-containing protein [Acidimicrobiales bacterium]
MRVAELMKTDLKTVRPDETVADAVTTLADAHVSALPVVDPHGRLVGVLSTSDVLGAMAEAPGPTERERVFEETLVGEIMTTRSLTIDAEADVTDAARQMLYLEVHRLFVEQQGRLVGVLS